MHMQDRNKFINMENKPAVTNREKEWGGAN